MKIFSYILIGICAAIPFRDYTTDPGEDLDSSKIVPHYAQASASHQQQQAMPTPVPGKKNPSGKGGHPRPHQGQIQHNLGGVQSGANDVKPQNTKGTKGSNIRHSKDESKKSVDTQQQNSAVGKATLWDKVIGVLGQPTYVMDLVFGNK